MDTLSNALWLNQLTSQQQVEQLLSAEDQNTPDKAAFRIGALKSILDMQSKFGKWTLFGGIFFAILGVPLMLLIVGFPMLVVGVVMIWKGPSQWRNADIRRGLLDSGLAIHVAKLSNRS